MSKFVKTRKNMLICDKVDKNLSSLFGDVLQAAAR